MQVPFFPLETILRPIRVELDQAISGVLDEGQFIMGEQVALFEMEFAKFVGAKYCVAVGSGLDALTISLKALGIGEGDEVLVPSHTCQATWLSVLRAGARPVGVSVNGFLIDHQHLEQSISGRTKAIMPVHLYGYPCEMDAVCSVASRYHLFVVEDFAQAHGATYKGRMAGSMGDAGGTSFYPTKNLGALGDGGAITTNSERVAAFARSYRNYGSVQKDVHLQVGVNSRLDTLQAAVLRVNLKHVAHRNKQRREIADVYFSRLSTTGDLVLPPRPMSPCEPVFHQFVIQTEWRNQLHDYLSKAGIGTAIHYPVPVYLQPAYAQLGYGRGSFASAEALGKTVLSLPVWPGMSLDQVQCVCDEVLRFFGTK